MKRKSPFGVRGSMTGLALAVGTLAAIPAAMAQTYETYGRSYYDPVRDVMVTPRMSSTTASPRVGYGPSPVYSSPGAVGVTREPIYGTAQVAPPTSRQFYGSGTGYTATRASSNVIAPPVPGIQSVPQSSAGLEQTPTSGISPSPAGTSGQINTRSTTVVGAAAPLPQPYYDAERDVMVTPSQSGTVRYIGGAQDQRYAMAQRGDSTFELVVRNGRLAQGPASLAVEHGSEVTLIVDSNIPDTLRIDGYNLAAPIAANQPMLLKFVAEQPGRFAYRLSTGREIGVLEVGPPQPANRVGLR
ncbi:MAG: hypothetical protein K0Q76_921 [Panacagrimonas sp.]|nr:hypothetical protein [Panacagrimonas sp.]MCC2655813.1 hypothetical protein [Panacagrimonas sp.]